MHRLNYPHTIYIVFCAIGHLVITSKGRLFRLCKNTRLFHTEDLSICKKFWIQLPADEKGWLYVNVYIHMNVYAYVFVYVYTRMNA